MTLLPGLSQPVELGRPGSVNSVNRARADGDKEPPHLLIIAIQRDPMTELPQVDELHPMAVLAEVTQALQGIPGRMTAIVRGIERVHLLDVVHSPGRLDAQWQRAHDVMDDPTLAYALAGALQDLIKQHDSLLPSSDKTKHRAQSLAVIAAERSPSLIADLCATHVSLDGEEMLDVLHERHVPERLQKVLGFISHRIHVLQVKRDLDRHVREHLSRHEQEALLRHKLRAIQSELGDNSRGGGNDDAWIDELALRLEENDLPEAARKIADKEIARLRRMNPQSGEATTARTYLELVADLPWGVETKDDLDIDAARALLAKEHYGLDKVKTRIIEYLCVRKLSPNKRGPILCLAGPPGVGKTSLSRSVAETLGRNFVRLSLGGIRDASEIRGHRRTYVGALPGRLIHGIKKAKSNNPVFLLDEIDKLGGDMRGDPAGALLEALDTQQNDEFDDHYLSTPFDLSNVIFICTANDISQIPAALRDRLEIIELGGYTLEEKVAIARDYLLPRVRRDHGLEDGRPAFDDGTLATIATRYTRESGVRNLQRELEAVVRDTVMGIAEARSLSGDIPAISESDLARVLGPPKFDAERIDDSPGVGIVTGLGWTPAGGRLLFVEARRTPGEGKIRLTGRLGDVMKESGQTALSLVRSMADHFGIEPAFLQKSDVHVHVPAGGVPKDGPSAGVAVATALVSLLTGKPVRNDVAMTGEITLRGKVLPIGGVREKVLAAQRAGITDVILPSRNAKDERDIPESVRDKVRLHYAKTLDEVLALALLDEPAAAE